MRARRLSHARILLTRIFGQLGLDEHDDEGKQHQRLDQCQSQNHHGLNAACCSRIARRAFARRRTNARLADGATEYCDGETNAGSQGFQANIVIGDRASGPIDTLTSLHKMFTFNTPSLKSPCLPSVEKTY